MTMRKILSAVAIVAAASLALAGCSSSGGNNPAPAASGGVTKIRVATNNAVGQLPVVIGIQEGIFKKHGLEVEQTVVPNITLIPAAVGKSYDLGYSAGPIAINAAAQGLPIVVTTGVEFEDKDNTPTHLLAQKDVKSLKDLEGKTIGAVTLTGTLHLATLAALRKAGLNTAAMKFVQIDTPNMLDQLRAGKVDAVELQQPYLSAGVAEGFSDLGDMVGPAMGYPTVMTYYVADKTWANNNKQVILDFRAALDEANAWILDNPDKARAAISKATGIDPAQTKALPLGGFDTKVTGDDIKKWGDLMKQESGFAGTVDYNSMVLPY